MSAEMRELRARARSYANERFDGGTASWHVAFAAYIAGATR